MGKAFVSYTAKNKIEDSYVLPLKGNFSIVCCLSEAKIVSEISAPAALKALCPEVYPAKGGEG